MIRLKIGESSVSEEILIVMVLSFESFPSQLSNLYPSFGVALI